MNLGRVLGCFTRADTADEERAVIAYAGREDPRIGGVVDTDVSDERCIERVDVGHLPGRSVKAQDVAVLQRGDVQG